MDGNLQSAGGCLRLNALAAPGNPPFYSVLPRETESLNHKGAPKTSRRDILGVLPVQRDTRIVLAAVVDSVLVCGVCFAIWIWHELYQPKRDDIGDQSKHLSGCIAASVPSELLIKPSYSTAIDSV